MKKLPYIIITLLFFGLLLLPHLADKLFVLERSSKGENRNMTPFPRRFNYSNIAKQLEEYYNDRIPFRAKLLEYCHKIQSKLFLFANGAALMGKNNFFYYQPDFWDNTLDHFRGKRALRQYELTKQCEFMKKLYAFLRARNIDFLFVTAPNKIQVYPEYLPERRMYEQSEKSPDRQFIDAMHKKYPAIPVLDLLPELLAAKKFYGDFLYYRADTHWSPVGAYIGAANIIKRVSPDNRNRLPMSGEFTIKKGKKCEPADMGNQVISKKIIAEYTEMVPEVAAFSGVITGNARKEIQVSVNPNAPDKRKVLIFRDSFTSNMQPYLSNHFREVHYIWTHQVSPKVISQVKPDIVIVECVARLMYKIHTVYTEF